MSRRIPARRDPSAGVTLVEVLVALALFALIGAAGFSVLDQVIRVQDRTDGRLQRLAQVQRTMQVLAQDFMQAEGGSLGFGDGAVAFRRSAGPGEIAVRYALEDGALVRTIAGRGSDAQGRQTLLPGVAALRWGFLDGDLRWGPDWPPPASEGPQGNPRAVSLDMLLQGSGLSGDLRRVAVLPADLKR